MEYTNKILELRNIINEKLLPLIDNDYIYVNLPYYENIGDILIWEGTMKFLSQIKYKCLYSTDIYNFLPQKIGKEVIIILQGGGNWGDLWTNHHLFRKKIIEMYPENKIIVFPQTVHYQEVSNMHDDIEFYNRYPNVTICTRDNVSYQLMKSNFLNNKILLVPDMAFFIDIKFKPQDTQRILFARRTDKELSSNHEIYKNIPSKAEVHDWPTYETDVNKRTIIKVLNRLTWICRKTDKLFNTHLKNIIYDFYWKHLIRPYYIKCGISFINNYNEIYSTRLHITILSFLMRKKIHIIDNNYGKTLNLINTWFTKKEIQFFFN